MVKKVNGRTVPPLRGAKSKAAPKSAPKAKRIKRYVPADDVDEAAEEKAASEQVVGTDQGDGGNSQVEVTIELAREIYEAGFNRDQPNQDEGYIDLKMIAGEEHWDPTAYNERIDEGRPAMVVNQMSQFVRQVTGDIRQMRPGVKVVPITDDASKDVAAKVLPGLIRYIERRSNATRLYYAAADQMVGAGMGHVMVVHEYAGERTMNQELRIAPVPDGLAVVWDADAVLPLREDAKDCFVPYDMSTRAFKAEHPDKSADSFSSSSEAFSNWASDDHVRVAIWFHKVKTKKRLALFADGRIDDVTDDDEAEAKAVQLGAEIKERDGWKVQRYLISCNDILEGPEDVPGPNIPVIPFVGEEVVIGRRVVRRGVVRVLRDVQRIYNYAISTQTEIIALQPKAPFIGTRAQFEKYADQWETANTRNWPYLEYTHVAGVPAPERSQPAVASTGLDDLLQITTQAMYSTTGIYPSALGAKSNETSGKAIMARQREGDTGTYIYNDNFTAAVERVGQVLVDASPDVYDTKRTIQITGEDGKIDALPINQVNLGDDAETHIALNDITKGSYLVAVEMGPSYSTKREESREGMLELIRTLGPQGAMMFIDLFIKALDWPLADKISERAKHMLPPDVREREAKEAGEEPPPPAPPTPEQQQMLEEQRLGNVELARKNELEERRQAIELEKLEVERARVRQEGLQLGIDTEQAARQAEIDRGNQVLESNRQTLERRGQDVEAIGMASGEINAEREHEIALNPEAAAAAAAAGKPQKPQPGAAASEGDVDQAQQQDIDELKGTVAELLEEVMRLREIIDSGAPPQPDINAGDGLQLEGGPALEPPPPASIDPGTAVAMGDELPPIA